MPLTGPTKRADCVSIKGSDLSELSTILSSSISKVKVKPLNSTGCAYDCNFSTTDRHVIGLCRYEGEMLVERESLSDKILIFLPTRGISIINVSGREIVSAPGRGAIIDADLHKNILLRGHREHHVVAIQKRTLATRISAILEVPVTKNIDFAPEIDLTSGAGMAIASVVATLQAGLAADGALRKAPFALASLSDALMQLIIDTLPHRFSADLARAAGSPVPRHVKKAIEFMRANLSKSLTLGEIAVACGASCRTLQQGFRQFKLTTPMAYIKYLRLEGVHHTLAHAEPGQTVADIATKWGFRNLGRFAADYRTRFGQLPSEALRFSPPGEGPQNPPMMPHL